MANSTSPDEHKQLIYKFAVSASEEYCLNKSEGLRYFIFNKEGQERLATHISSIHGIPTKTIRLINDENSEVAVIFDMEENSNLTHFLLKD